MDTLCGGFCPRSRLPLEPWQLFPHLDPLADPLPLFPIHFPYSEAFLLPWLCPPILHDTISTDIFYKHFLWMTADESMIASALSISISMYVSQVMYTYTDDMISRFLSR